VAEGRADRTLTSQQHFLDLCEVFDHPQPAQDAAQPAKRTLTNLYHERPTWLDLAHRKLDEAVFAAYGWDPSLWDDEILGKLLALNQAR